MKKIFVLAVLLVVIGVICVLFFTKEPDNESQVEEKPWTVGDVTETTVVEETTKAKYDDAIVAYTEYVNKNLRDSFTFLSTEEKYQEDDLQNAILGVYVYDLDGDTIDDLSVVRVTKGEVFLDVYDFKDGTVQYADSMKLVLDPMVKQNFSMNLSDFKHLAARMTIYPDANERLFCLTVEQEKEEGNYAAYTVAIEFVKKKLAIRKSFRLRQSEDALTLMETDNATLLYSSVEVTEEQVKMGLSAPKYKTLDEAFKFELNSVGLNAPKVVAEGGVLKGYKVTAVEHEQKLFDIGGNSTTVEVTSNGFLHSFILNV